MEGATWIDVASDTVTGWFAMPHSDQPFTDQQKGLLQELLKQFGEAIGVELAAQIGRLFDR